jgi:hypothetical protein
VNVGDVTEKTGTSRGEPRFVYRILRYTSDLVRDEWVNIGVLLIDRTTGERRLKLIQEQEEIARVQRLQPAPRDELLVNLRDHLEDRLEVFFRDSQESGQSLPLEKEVQRIVEKWDNTLSNGLQLAPQKGLDAEDLDVETERLYREHVSPPRRPSRVGAPNSKQAIRDYCEQVWRAAGIWNHFEKSVRVSQFTFPGDPFRIDFMYRINGKRGLVQPMSVSRSPYDATQYAHRAKRIAQHAPFASEFTAVTDVELDSKVPRHQFVVATLQDAGIEPVPMIALATWAARLKEVMRQ